MIEQDTQQQALGKALAKQLRQDDRHLSPPVAHRLQQARLQALRQPQAAATGKTLVLSLLQQRHAWLLLFGLLLGLSYWVLQPFSNHVSDAYLLSEELPPEAFINEEFGAWISQDGY